MNIVYPGSLAQVVELEQTLRNEIKSENSETEIIQLAESEDSSSFYKLSYVVAEDDGRVIGAATIMTVRDRKDIDDVEEKICELYKLYVSPSYRRKNVGEELFKKSMEEMNSIGFNIMKVQVMKGSIDFWKKMYDKYPHEGDEFMPVILFCL